MLANIQSHSMAGTIIAAIVFIAILVLLTCAIFSINKSRIIKVTIDDKGIHGTCKKRLKSGYRNYNIRWEKLTDVEAIISHRNNNYIDFFAKDAEFPYNEINLEFLPAKKVVDAINYFYGRKMGINKQPALIKPLLFEEQEIVRLIIIVLSAALIIYLTL